MGRTIAISPVTRIEGHAKVTIDLDDSGNVSRARLHILEFRGFEKFCEGKPFEEMPGLMARVCGICPVSHVLASSKAGDELLGVVIPPAAILQRRLVNHAQLLQSHALSFFHLSAPDLLLGMDADIEQRNVFGLIEKEPELARRGIRLRQYGQRIIEAVGGQKIHPSWSTAGGVRHVVTAAERDELLAWLPEAYETVEIGLSRLKPLLDSFADEIEHLGNFPSLFLGMVGPEGELEYYDGLIRICDAEGNIVADDLDPKRYATFIGEASEAWSFMKFPYYKPMGYPAGMYRVGPLARLNIARVAGTPKADHELREFKHRSQGAVCDSFAYHQARLIEMLHAVEKIEEILNDETLLNTETRAKALRNREEGIGACEAPRGTLFHHYHVDKDGLMTQANLLIATGQNNLAMNQTVEQAAKRYVKANDLKEGMLNRVEAAVRCYDPCLSCSTHAIGQMPLVIEIMNSAGELQERIARD